MRNIFQTAREWFAEKEKEREQRRKIRMIFNEENKRLKKVSIRILEDIIQRVDDHFLFGRDNFGYSIILSRDTYNIIHRHFCSSEEFFLRVLKKESCKITNFSSKGYGEDAFEFMMKVKYSYFTKYLEYSAKTWRDILNVFNY